MYSVRQKVKGKVRDFLYFQKWSTNALSAVLSQPYWLLFGDVPPTPPKMLSFVKFSQPYLKTQDFKLYIGFIKHIGLVAGIFCLKKQS